MQWKVQFGFTFLAKNDASLTFEISDKFIIRSGDFNTGFERGLGLLVNFYQVRQGRTWSRNYKSPSSSSSSSDRFRLFSCCSYVSTFSQFHKITNFYFFTNFLITFDNVLTIF
jgi:hypothetical protein